MLTVYEAWSPLLEIAHHWSEGRHGDAISLTIFAVILALAVAIIVAVVFAPRLGQSVENLQTFFRNKKLILQLRTINLVVSPSGQLE